MVVIGESWPMTLPGSVGAAAIGPASTPAKTSSVRGPTMAITNSCWGVSGSRWMFDTPPKRNRVMLRTGTPRALATRECASSWANTEAKTSSAATRASPHWTPAPHSG